MILAEQDVMSQHEPGIKATFDDTLYELDIESLMFFISQTGIEDEELLKTHIMQVQRTAYQVFRYPCIRAFDFAKLRMSKLPAYHHVLGLGRDRDDVLLLDIGCCFGTDVRKLVADGFPVTGVIASDLESRFWELGHELFRSTFSSFPVAFVAGDALSDTFIPPMPPVYFPQPQNALLELNNLTSLAPLRGRVSAIHASSLFHLFQEEEQEILAIKLASLLSAAPGSVIFGYHGGLPTKGFRAENRDAMGLPRMFAHSPESWSELWSGKVFTPGSVKVESELKVSDTERGKKQGHAGEFYWLQWSVTRL